MSGHVRNLLLWDKKLARGDASVISREQAWDQPSDKHQDESDVFKNNHKNSKGNLVFKLVLKILLYGFEFVGVFPSSPQGKSL